MAGLFELFVDAHSRYRFRLKAPEGTVMAVSKAFDDKLSAVSGIRHVREYAGTGLIRDLSVGEPLMPGSLIGADAVLPVTAGARAVFSPIRVPIVSGRRGRVNTAG
jgi:uncharacterized protein YegP (UPF0339 family)